MRTHAALVILRTTVAILAIQSIWSIVLGQTPDLTLPKSRELLDSKIQDLRDQAKRDQSIKAALEKLQGDIKVAEDCVANAQTDAASSSNVAKLRAAWEAFKNVPSGTVLDIGHPQFEALVAAVQDLPGGKVTNCLQALWPASRLGAEKDPGTSAVVSLLDQSLAPLTRRQRATGISSLLGWLSGDGRTRAQIPPHYLEAASNDVEALTKNPESLVPAAHTALDQLKVLTNAQLQDTSQQIVAIDKQLAAIDDRLSTNTAALDKALVYAVYGMIGSLLLLFLGLRFLPTETQGKVVENRSLVEVVSMAFLLLTIIILGTGEKMPREAIGTLLGSIAGYIFGQKLSDKNKSH